MNHAKTDSDIAAQFPESIKTVGEKVAYLSSTLLPQKRFEEYLTLMDQLLDEKVHYVDPVHTFHNKTDVIKMLAKYVPRSSNEGFKFQLISDEKEHVIWKWTISLRIKFFWLSFKIHGLVHAELRNDKIVYQREYYDPMESIEVIPIIGRLYKLILRFA